jgi:iron complex transport system substrate-binding protein
MNTSRDACWLRLKPTNSTYRRIALLAACLQLPAAHAEIVLKDDVGATVRLPAPAQRIVSLAPHLTENLFAIGAGGQLVGTVEYSDFPPAAKKVPRVGGYSRFDLEAVVALRPDLVISWQSGNDRSHIDKLRAAGLTVYQSQPERFEDIASELRRLGQLTGHDAEPIAQRFLARLKALRETYSGQPPVRVFYQVWQEPLHTVGGPQIISTAIAACGGVNVFGDLKVLAPQVSYESVLAADAEVFVAGGMGEVRKDWLEAWRRWPQLTAVKRDNLFFVHADLMQRHTLRLMDGAEKLCEHLETARRRRPVARTE